jgi:prolyl oligopeptidase
MILIALALVAGAQAASHNRVMTNNVLGAAVQTDDPYIWLEDKDGAKPLAWVAAENARTLPRLQNDPRYEQFFAEALTIASAKDRIAMPMQLRGRIYNFWRDADHPQGVLRWASKESYSGTSPAWTVALDLDALSRAENRKWVWKGLTCLEPDERRCLVALSEGGEDAVTYREFDLEAGTFVVNGFNLPRSKQGADWIDADTLLVSRDWGAGTMTDSGYPFVVKRVRRGQSLAQAEEVYRGKREDQLGTYGMVLEDGSGNRVVTVQRRPTFFGGETLIEHDGRLVKLELPARAFATGMVDGQVIFETSDHWGAIPAGAVASAPLADVVEGRFTPELVFAPTARQSVDRVTTTRNHVIASIYDNVRGRAVVFMHGPGGWTQRKLALPDNASIGVASTTDHGDDAYLTVTSFLAPTTLWSVSAEDRFAPQQVKALPARFDASGLVSEQFEAVSSDGTKIPYFVVHAKKAPLDGSTPTLMTAYGGFQASMTPSYAALTGKLWLERGGAYVLANIRGGGEFGPAWHDAGRKTKRQVIYDDFAAVARDLFARRVTGPSKLGIYGGSNGGLLMGVEFNQHPEMWKAVAIQVPLLDMIRYEGIAAGASWVDEYGSVSVPEERAFLEEISPYQNLKRGVNYPEPYIWTTTADDRVGPQHARKFAARMKEYGLPYLFYEDTAGGHSGDADIEQGARLNALQMTYFAQKLFGPADAK